MVTNVYKELDGSVTYEFRSDDGDQPVTDRVTLTQQKLQSQIGFIETAADRIRRFEHEGRAPRVVESGFLKSGSLYMVLEIRAYDPS
jgi:hypothetical protein